MVIGGVNGANHIAQPGLSGMNMQEDSISKDLKRQIEKAQKQLQEISSNQDLSMEEKMKKRQEIQQEIASLNQQLRQHQIEQRKEQQTVQKQSKGNAMDEVLGGSPAAGSKKTDKSGSGLSQASMQSMISADSSMKQAQVQGSVATKMEGRANVLEAEIKQDGGKGENSLEAKEGELAETRQKAQEATGAQASALAEANQAAKEAAKAEQSGQADEKDSETDEKGGQVQKEDGTGQENAPATVDIRL